MFRSVLSGQKRKRRPFARKTHFSSLGLERLEDRLTPSSWQASLSSGAVFSNQSWGDVSSGAGWSDFQTGDFNGDGKADVAMCSAAGQWWVGLSTGSGFNWQLWTTWSTGATWLNVHTADFNGDGKTDLIGYVKETGQWWVALSTGSSFSNQLWTTWSTGGNWSEVSVSDFTGDGKADILGWCPYSGQWWLARSTGSSFQSSLWTTWSTATNWTNMLAGDFNGDGKTDIAGCENGRWWVGVSTGSSFSTSLWTAWSNIPWANVAEADFNGDGKADIVARDPWAGNWWLGLSTGSGFKTAYWSTWSTGVTWSDLQIADFNGDGKADISARALQSGQLWTGLSTGSNFATTLWGGWSPYTNWSGVEAADVTGNHKADLIALGSSNIYVSTRGSDANPGSYNAPFRNISTGLAHLKPGWNLYIEGGIYYEHVVVNVAGTPTNPITISSYNGTAVIDGSTQGWTAGGNQNLGVVEVNSPYVILQGLKIVNSLDTGIVLNADNVTISGDEIDNSQRHAISTNSSRQTNYPGLAGTMIHNITITGNTVVNNVLKGHGYGQAISLIADGFVISNNIVAYNICEGIDIWLGAMHGQVTGNSVYGNGAAGIYTDGVSYVRIDHNQVFSNKSGIGVSSESPYYSSHNIWVYDNVIFSNAQSGLYLWDSDTTPGYLGSQNVLMTNNTLVNNATSIYMHGQGNTAQIMNNLAYCTGNNLYDSSVSSSYNIHNNVWLTNLSGFISAATNNFDLLSTSPALNAGSTIPAFADNLGNVFTVTTDYAYRPRTVSTRTDAGAYEHP